MLPLYIVTRFNIAVNYGASKQATTVPGNKPWLDEDYLSKRFDIFEKYTLPSLMRQTDSDFEWIILFHEDTPSKYKERISEYCRMMDNINSWFMNDDESLKALDLVGAYLDSVRTKIGTEILSVRIDNDDMINREFVKRVKEELSDCDKTSYLSFKNGLSYNILNGYCASFNEVGNHFLAMRSGKDITYILQAGVHDQVMKKDDESKKIVKSSNVPMWVELISDTNCANVIRWSGFSEIFLPYGTAKEYPELRRLWKNRAGYVFKCLLTPLRYFSNQVVCLIKYRNEWRKG